MKFLNSLLGFAGGAFVLAAPAYSSEIAETKYRGALGTLMQLMVCCGILFINVNCSTDWRGNMPVVILNFNMEISLFC